MKAQVIHDFGDIDVFRLENIEKPIPADHEVIVKIYSSSVNTADLKARELGKQLDFVPTPPAILGMDFSGVIEQIGSSVQHFKVGEEVYGCAGGVLDLQGTLAEYINADAKLIAKKPSSLSYNEAAAMPLVGITVVEGFRKAQIHKGDKVLVHGGAGGVGHIAIQYAKILGLEVYSTCRSSQRDTVTRLGAIPIDFENLSPEDYVQEYTGGLGFDLVYDSVGGENLINSFKATKRNGQVITTVSMLYLDLSLMHQKGLSLHVVYMLIPMMYNENRESHAEILNMLTELCDSGQIRPLIDSVFPLSDAPKAHQKLANGSVRGKVIIQIAET